MDENDNGGVIELRRRSKLTGIPSFKMPALGSIGEEEHDDPMPQP